jgi:hypothetical protein
VVSVAIGFAYARASTAGETTASGVGIDLQWEAPPECPDASGVKLYAEQLLGQPLETRRSPRVAARARVRRNDAGNWELRLSLSVGDRVDEDVLVAKQCRALADVTALKVALATDPVAVVESIEPVATRSPSGSPVEVRIGRSIPDERDRSESGRPSRRSRATVALRATFGTGFGPLPGVSPGAGLFGSIDFRTYRVELGGQAFWGTDARYAALPNVGAHLQLVSGIVRGCATPTAGALKFPICLGFEAGVMRGEGFGVATTRTSTSGWGAFIIGPALRVPVGRLLSLWLEADAVIPVVRPGVNIRNLDTLYLAPSGGSRVWAGVEMNLGL